MTTDGLGVQSVCLRVSVGGVRRPYSATHFRANYCSSKRCISRLNYRPPPARGTTQGSARRLYLVQGYGLNHAYLHKTHFFFSNSAVGHQCEYVLSWRWRSRSG